MGKDQVDCNVLLRVGRPEDFARLRRWFAEKDWERWDRQIESDSAAGKLDFLLDEVSSAKVQGTLRDL